MKRHWTSDDLIEHFTLLPAERALLDPLRAAHTRLGFAVLLKSFQLDGRFPTTPHEVPAPVVAFLAGQIAVDPTVYLHYEWRGRASEEHRAQIRALLGVRSATVEDAAALTALATDYLLQTHRRDLTRLRLAVLEHCRTLKLEPPTAQRLDRILNSALAAYNEHFYANIGARLSEQSRTALDALLTTIEPASPDADAPALAAARRTALQVLKSDPGPMAVETAREEVDKLQRLRALDLPTHLFTTVPPHVTAVAILALVALGLSTAGPDATAASRPARAYLPVVGCEDCAGRATRPTPQPSPSATPSPSVYAARMIELVNQARAAVGCPAVTSHDTLMRGARAWSEKMARESIYEHSGSSYYESFGYPYGPLENIGTGETPEYAMEGWMQSPSHKRNLEWCYPLGDPSYDPALVYDVGVGYAWPGYWTLAIGNHMP